MDDNNPYASPASPANRAAKAYRPTSFVLGIIAVVLLYGLSKWFESQYRPDDMMEGNVQNFILSEILHGVSICLFFHLITKSLGFSFGWRIGLNALAAILAYALFAIVVLSLASVPGLLPMLLHPMAIVGLLIKFIVCSTLIEFGMYELAVRFKKQETARTPP